MILNLDSRLFRYTALLLTIAITFVMVWNSAKSWISYEYASDPPPEGLKDAISIEKGNAEFYFLLGQYYDIYDFTAPRDKAYSLYKNALILNPFNYNYWFFLARFLTKEGRRDEAVFALEQATRLSPGVVSLRWGAGMLASELGEKKLLLDNLAPVIANDPQRRKKAFTVLWQTLRNGEEIMNIIPDKVLPQYLHFLISTKRTNEAVEAWGKLSASGEVPENLFVRYVSFLISENELSAAKEAWTLQLGDWNGIWNGNFENKIMDGGFDWRIRSMDGSKITQGTENGKDHLIKIEFDGEHNVDFRHLSQVVPVKENNKYKLSSLMKTENISTGNGLFWQVYCLSSKGLSSESELLRGTTDFRWVNLSFETPRGCNSVVIRLRRNKSNKIDKNISGTAWIDKVVLENEF